MDEGIGHLGVCGIEGSPKGLTRDVHALGGLFLV